MGTGALVIQFLISSSSFGNKEPDLPDFPVQTSRWFNRWETARELTSPAHVIEKRGRVGASGSHIKADKLRRPAFIMSRILGKDSFIALVN